jgi:hypothetical protein
VLANAYIKRYFGPSCKVQNVTQFKHLATGMQNKPRKSPEILHLRPGAALAGGSRSG